jgi:hypothetical protein
MNEVCSEIYMLARWFLVLLITKDRLKLFVRFVDSCDLHSMYFVTSGLIDTYLMIRPKNSAEVRIVYDCKRVQWR